jgi:hypothetical protein
VIDRYALLCKPDLVDSLRPKIKPKPGELRALNYIPASITEAMIINVEDPNRTLNGIEAAVAGRIGVGQSFLLRQFMIGARESFFGLKSDESTGAALGDEIASFNQSDNPDHRVWLLAARNQAGLKQIVERYLTTGGAAIKRESHDGVELLVSSDTARGAAATLGEFTALGKRQPLTALIEARRAGNNLQQSPLLTAAEFPAQPTAIVSLSSDLDESSQLMAALSKLLAKQLHRPTHNPAGSSAAGQLPAAISATTFNEKGVYLESRGPFGNFPFFVSTTASVIDGR